MVCTGNTTSSPGLQSMDAASSYDLAGTEDRYNAAVCVAERGPTDANLMDPYECTCIPTGP